MRQAMKELRQSPRSVHSSWDLQTWRKDWPRMLWILKKCVLNRWRRFLSKFNPNIKLNSVINLIWTSRATLSFINFILPSVRSSHSSSKGWSRPKNLISSSRYTLRNNMRNCSYSLRQLSLSMRISSKTFWSNAKIWRGSMQVGKKCFNSQNRSIFRF
jgi:hypothetical protein